MDKYIGIDLGGSKIRFNDIDIDGNTGKEYQALISPGINNRGLIDLVIRNVEKLIKKVNNNGDNLIAIGFGSPGPLDYKKGIIERPPNLSEIKNLPIVKILGESFPEYPAFLVHDADAALIGERWLGAAKNFDNVTMATFGTGVGFAVIDNGRLIRGKGRASEAGHTSIDTGWRRLCSCGRFSHWEAFVSTDGLAQTYQDAFHVTHKLSLEEKYNISFEFRKWLSENPVIKSDSSNWISVRSRYCDDVVLGLRNILCNFDPECIVLGGGIITGSEPLFNAIKERWNEYMFEKVEDSMAQMAKGMELRLAKLSNAGVIGAAKYAMDQIK